jgi:hypothetical protein
MRLTPVICNQVTNNIITLICQAVFIGGNIFILVTEKKSGVLFYRPVKFPGFFPSDAAYLISKELITKIMGGMSGTLSDWQSYGRLHGKDILYLLRKKI